MKHTICKLQEQIFHLQMKLIEKDLYPGQCHFPELVLIEAGPPLSSEARLCAPVPCTREARAAACPDVLFWHGSYIDSETLNKAELWVTGVLELFAFTDPS